MNGESGDPGSPPSPVGGPKVVVVGPCASGKSTLVAGLRRLGFEAAAVGQEHSEIPTLWRHSNPDVVVALEVDLATIRERRGVTEWPVWLYDAQRRRLQGAEAAATIHVDTTVYDAEAVLALVADQLAVAEDLTGGRQERGADADRAERPLRGGEAASRGENETGSVADEGERPDPKPCQRSPTGRDGDA